MIYEIALNTFNCTIFRILHIHKSTSAITKSPFSSKIKSIFNLVAPLLSSNSPQREASNSLTTAHSNYTYTLAPPIPQNRFNSAEKKPRNTSLDARGLCVSIMLISLPQRASACARVNIFICSSRAQSANTVSELEGERCNLYVRAM